MKDPAHEALAAPGRRRVRGIAAQSIFVTLLLMAANFRKIAAFRTPRDHLQRRGRAARPRVCRSSHLRRGFPARRLGPQQPHGRRQEGVPNSRKGWTFHQRVGLTTEWLTLTPLSTNWPNSRSPSDSGSALRRSVERCEPAPGEAASNVSQDRRTRAPIRQAKLEAYIALKEPPHL